MTPPQILHAVAVEGRKPKFLDGVPADFQVCSLSPKPTLNLNDLDSEPR